MLASHCAAITVLPVAGPPATSATRQWSPASMLVKRGRATARAGTAGHPNLDPTIGSRPLRVGARPACVTMAHNLEHARVTRSLGILSAV